MFSRVPAICCCTVVTLYRRQQRIWIMLLYFITSGLPHLVEKHGVFGWWYDRTEVGVSACDIHNHLFKAKINYAPKFLRSKFSCPKNHKPTEKQSWNWFFDWQIVE